MAKKNNLDLNHKVSRTSLSQEQLNKKISVVAYDLYRKGNCAPGNDLVNWIEAEKIVKKDQQSISVK